MSTSLFSHGALMLSAAPNTSTSGAPVPFWSVGTEIDTAPISGLNDGVLATYVAAEEATAAPAIDLRVARRVDAAFGGNHNITAGTCRLQSSNASNFGVLITDVACTYQQPNFWVDLRGLAEGSRTARYWRFLFTGNAAPIKLGEMALAQVESVPHFQWNYSENRTYPERNQGTTPMGALVRQKRGFAMRDMSGVRFVGPDATVEAVLRRVAFSAGTTVIPVLFIPESTGADAWLIDWEDTYTTKRIIENRRETVLVIPEQSPGLLTALLGTRAAAAGGASMHFLEAYLTANVNLPNNTPTALAFNAEVSDTSGMHDNVSNPSRGVIPTGADGLWVIAGQISFAPSAGAWAGVNVYIDGVRVKMNEAVLHGTNAMTVQVLATIQVTAGQYLEIVGHQISGGVLQALGGSRDLTSVCALGPIV